MESGSVGSWNLLPRVFAFGLFTALAIWQSWMVGCLFDKERPWNVLLSPEPITSGNHPLHLYHGYLGSKALRDHGSSCCYDPAFQVGYPKTPIFDAGCRPAELFMLFTGGRFHPAAYKIGLAVVCLIAPLLVVAGARALGFAFGNAALTGWMGMLIWWSGPGRAALESGDLDVLLVSLALPSQFAFLVAHHQRPSLWAWMGLGFCTALAWFAHPMITALAMPLVLIYYLSVGARHGIFWHGALFVGLAGGVAINSFWLVDWVSSWWLRNPLTSSTFLLPHRTLATVWRAPIWGSSSDRAYFAALAGLALAGSALLNFRRHRAAARLFGLGGASMLVIAIAGMANESIAKLSGPALLLPAFFLMTPPAAYALWELASQLMGWAGWHPLRLGLVLATAVAGFVGVGDTLTPWIMNYSGTRSLMIGLPQERARLVDAVKNATTTEARILWEDPSDASRPSSWSALLPILTGRSFVGGLDPERGIEHSTLSLSDQALAGRSLNDWTDRELVDYCRRYNIGWVACTSPAAVARFQTWSAAQFEAAFDDPAGRRSLFTIKDAPRSFILKGHAEVAAADSDRITLSNLAPEHGEIVLSFHFHRALKVIPSEITIEPQLDPVDSIGLIRLKVPTPLTSLTLVWRRE